MTLKEKRKWIKKLTPYWSSYKTMRDEFHKNVYALETRMSQETKMSLEFFWCDNSCVGIGAIDGYREKFPLFRADDLGGY